jgi:hypothetical protein
VAAEATIAGDRAARESLAGLEPLQRAVTLIDQDPARPASDAVDRHARALLAGLGLPAPTRPVLLNPVRLGGRVVRLAAIEPLGAWAGRPPGRCRSRACPVLVAGGTVGPRTLRAPGVRIAIAGAGRLRSAAPLGFLPAAHGQRCCSRATSPDCPRSLREQRVSHRLTGVGAAVNRSAQPVLTDPATASAVGPSAELPVTVDGEPVTARVVGTLRRFPTIPAGGPGFVIADEATLDGALDASLPGQGRTDELWISTAHPAPLRAALRRPPLKGLSVSFRADVRGALSGDPIARGVLGTLLVAAATSAVLAIVGLLAALLGAMRDVRAERDLIVLGLSPRQLRHERRARVLVAGTLGTIAGLMLAAVLTRLVVGAVRAAGTVAVPDPPLVAIAPWGELGPASARRRSSCATCSAYTARVGATPPLCRVCRCR